MKKLPFIYTLVRGAIGKKFVVKHYRYGIVITKFPAMENIVASKKQRHCRNLFCRAVAYATMVNKDAALKAAWQQRITKGTVYHAAIKAFMQAATVEVKLPVAVRRCKAVEKVVYDLAGNTLSLSGLAVNTCFLKYKETG